MSYKIKEDYLIYNKMSRSGRLMKGIRGIAFHWVANPKSTAQNNRDYFNNLRNQTTRYASSHEIIGLDGEVIKAVPSNEVAFHAGAKKYKQRVNQLLNGSPNDHLYGIEVCHPDWSGQYSPITYKTVVERGADLLIQFNLKPSKDTIWRHYDVTGKDCPKYYVENPAAWDKLIKDITDNYNTKIKGDEIVEKLDPNPAAWAEKEWQWAKQKGLMDGSRPREPITRQEIAIILYRLLTDASISEWAEDAIVEAKSLGITDGSRMGSLATREEVVKMLMGEVERGDQ